MVIETMSHDHSKCIRPTLPPYSVSSQKTTFNLKGTLANITSFYVWYSKLGFSGNQTVMMKRQADLKVTGGMFSLDLIPDMILTLATVSTGSRGQHPTPLPSKQLELPY